MKEQKIGNLVLQYEELPPVRRKPRGIDWLEHLMPLAEEREAHGKWARVYEAINREQANYYVNRLNAGEPDLPVLPGKSTWEFAARNVDGTHCIFARVNKK